MSTRPTMGDSNAPDLQFGKLNIIYHLNIIVIYLQI